MSLAAAVLLLAPLEAQLVEPLQFLAPRSPATPMSAPSLAARRLDAVTTMFAAAGLRAPRPLAEPGELSTFDRIAVEALAAAPAESLDFEDPAAAVARARSRDMWGTAQHRHAPAMSVRSTDGVALSVFRGGRSTGTPVLIFGAPGTPAALIGGWLRNIGEDRSVATWETRGMFGPASETVTALGIEAQIHDAGAVLDAAGWPDAHVLAICGGAALAVAFAAEHPDRVRSLGLWFGDYELGTSAPKTDHQRNLQALMHMAVQRRISPDQLRAVLLQAVTKRSEPDFAPLVMYPFANADLLGRYCRMNHSIMSTDLRRYLDRVRAPSVVVYSPDDVTTHPEGSRFVAARLRATLESVPASGHLHAFRGHAPDVGRALSFMRRHDYVMPPVLTRA